MWKLRCSKSNPLIRYELPTHHRIILLRQPSLHPSGDGAYTRFSASSSPVYPSRMHRPPRKVHLPLPLPLLSKPTTSTFVPTKGNPLPGSDTPQSTPSTPLSRSRQGSSRTWFSQFLLSLSSPGRLWPIPLGNSLNPFYSSSPSSPDYSESTELESAFQTLEATGHRCPNSPHLSHRNSYCPR